MKREKVKASLMRAFFIFGIALATSMPACLSSQQTSVPKEIQSAELLGALQAARAAADVGLQPNYEVSVEMRVDITNLIAASKITFHPESRLIFSRSAQGKPSQFSPSQSLIIVAEEIQIEGRLPALVTWGRELAGPRVEGPPRGRPAPTGAPGALGADGGPGLKGEDGNPGFPGASAPNLYIIVGRVTGGTLAIDMRGQDGSSGGFGQQGGEGGRGGPGQPAVGNILNCVSGAGYGGKGGRGGDGGRGGQGGDGGRGGNVFIISASGSAEKFARLLIINASGGNPGKGGEGGPGGRKGLGGEPGNPAPPFCREEPVRKGLDGADGDQGKPGLTGKAGESGDIYFSELGEKQLQRLFSSDQLR